MNTFSRVLWCLSLVALMGTVSATSYEPITSAHAETTYNDLSLFIETTWYKVPAMDVIEATITVSEDEVDSQVLPVFYLRYPDDDVTDEPNVPYEGEDCLGENKVVSVKFYIWCHDFGGWSIFVFLKDQGIFHRIGRTELDFPVGTWAIIVVDKETGETIAEVPLEVRISKPTETTKRLKKQLQ